MMAAFIAEFYERARDYLVELLGQLREFGEKGMRMPILPGEYPELVDAFKRVLEAWEDGGTGNVQDTMQVRTTLLHWAHAVEDQQRYTLEAETLTHLISFLNKYLKRKLRETTALDKQVFIDVFKAVLKENLPLKRSQDLVAWIAKFDDPGHAFDVLQASKKYRAYLFNVLSMLISDIEMRAEELDKGRRILDPINIDPAGADWLAKVPKHRLLALRDRLRLCRDQLAGGA